MEAAHGLLRTLTSNPQFSSALRTEGVLTSRLDNLGYGGLWRSCSLASMDDMNKVYFELTGRLIEVS